MMSLFEVYVTTSAVLAGAIPTFFEKVMRPGYEKRVYQFKKSSLEEYKKLLNEAVEIFNREEQLTDEIIEKMEDVVVSWDTVQSNDTKFENLMKKRNLFTIGWLFVLTFSLLAIYSRDVGTIFAFNSQEYVNHVFFGMIVLTIWYVHSLLSFDNELTRFSGEERREITRRARGVSSFGRESVSELRNIIRIKELLVAQTLLDNKIPYELEVKGRRVVNDIVIPNIRNPKVFVELKVVKGRFFSPVIDRLSLLSILTKREYPNSKMVLFINDKKETLTGSVKARLKEDFDKIFDYNETDKFIQYVKQELD